MVRALNVLPPPAPSPSDRRRPHDPVLEQGQPAVSHPPQPPGDLTAAGDIVPEPLQQSETTESALAALLGNSDEALQEAADESSDIKDCQVSAPVASVGEQNCLGTTAEPFNNPGEIFVSGGSNPESDVSCFAGVDSVDGHSEHGGLLPDLGALLSKPVSGLATSTSWRTDSPSQTFSSSSFGSSQSPLPVRRGSDQSNETFLHLSLEEPYSESLSPVSILAQLDSLQSSYIRMLIRDLVKDNLRLMRVLGETNSFMANHQSAFDKIISRQGEKPKDDTISVHNLSSQLDVAEEAQAQLSQDLQRVTGEKLELGNRLSGLQVELEQQRAELVDARGKLERIEKEKWEMNRVNADLQQRLQQTVALAHMQAEGNESRLQEEVGTLLVQLEEEREVTAKLSKNLELERRKHESFEQRSKGSSGKRDGSKRRSSLLPEEIRDSESRLIASMDLYRHRCDNLGASLASCQQQLDRDSWHPDLAIEISKLRKLLGEEKRSCHTEGEKLKEVHQLFEQVYQDYSTVLDSIKQDKKQKGQNVLENIKESNIRDNVDSLTARLMDTEESLNRERDKSAKLETHVARLEADLDALPLLQAQVEVYQSDFNAEREARERIAGEKADLLEELNKLRQSGVQNRQEMRPTHPRSPEMRRPEHTARLDVDRHMARPEVDRHIARPEGHLVENMRNRIDQRQEDERLPLPVRLHNQRAVGGEEDQGRGGGGGGVDLNCPKCGREFRNTTLLTRHVNDCLDRDF